MLIKAGKFKIYCCCLLLFDMNGCCVVVNGLLLVSHNIVVDDERYVVRTKNPPTVTKLAKRIFSRLGKDVTAPSKSTRTWDESVMHGKDTTETSLVSVQTSSKVTKHPPARRATMSRSMPSRSRVIDCDPVEQLVYRLVMVVLVRLSDDDTTVSKRKFGEPVWD